MGIFTQNLRRNKTQGVSLIEVLVSVVVLSIGGVLFSKSMQIHAKHSDQFEREARGQRFESLLRSQLY